MKTKPLNIIVFGMATFIALGAVLTASDTLITNGFGSAVAQKESGPMDEHKGEFVPYGFGSPVAQKESGPMDEHKGEFTPYGLG